MIQHLVSKVLLRRWARYPNGKGPISGLDLRSLKERTDSVKKFGGLEDPDLTEPGDTEKVWANEVEKRLPHAFAQLDAGKLLDNPVSIEVVKNLIVLHWARGFALTELLASFIPQKVDEIKTVVLENHSHAEALKALTGLDLVSTNMDGLLHNQIFLDFMDNVQKERFLDRQFIEMYRRGQDLIRSYKLEIWHSTTPQFLIGDAPVVSYNKDEDKVGVLQGVAWNDADALFMPLGPNHAVALAKKHSINKASSRVVEQLNVYQTRAALREVFYHPDSNLGRVISEAIKKNEKSDSPPSK